MRHPEFQHQAMRDVGVHEQLRRERHHDVLSLVLGKFERGMDAGEFVALARHVADLAYPPPKDE